MSALPPVVFCESPYSANAETGASIDRHLRYLNLVMSEMALVYGECPYASHAYMTQHPRSQGFFVTDYDSKWNILTRERAIAASQAIRHRCDRTVFYTDLGWSRGMTAAKAYCTAHGLPFDERQIDAKRLAAECPRLTEEFTRAIIDPKQDYTALMLD